MARYSYDGPVQHISIADGQTKGPDGQMQSSFRDVALIPGADPIDLPADNETVLAMVDAGQLVPADDTTAPKATTKKKGAN